MGELRLPAEQFHPDALEYYGGISTLKAGLVTADRITTVSPTYAEELMRPEFGMGLEGVIAARSGASVGHPERRGYRRVVAEAETVPFTRRFAGRQRRKPRRRSAPNSDWMCRGRWPSSSAG